MKKYRLIEYDPLFSGEYHNTEIGVYNSAHEAYNSMTTEQEKHKHFYYRIEEVERSITDRVKTYEDACEVLGTRPIKVAESLKIVNSFGIDRCLGIELEPHIIALLKLETITAALNEGWKPDWEDNKQPKFYPLFQNVADKGGSTIRLDEGADEFSYIVFPSRLVLKSKELAEYAGKWFADLYKQLLIEKL